MSIYTKPISQLTTADLDELLQANAVENIRLEFKLTVPAKDETLKKLTSFANTFGGLVVIGAQANSADGRIQALPGVGTENGYKQRIMQWSFDEVDPPLVVEVSDPIPAPGHSAKVCYVISIAESDAGPHFLNGRKGIWIRTDEFSNRFDAQLANENEIRHLLDRRRLVRERRASLIERARKRFSTHLEKKYTDKEGNKTKIGPLLELWIVPRFPTKTLVAQEDLQKIVRQRYMNWRGGIFPDFTRTQFTSQHESVIVLDAPPQRTGYFELNAWGLVYYGLKLETKHFEIEGIHTFELAGAILLFLSHASEMYKHLGYSGPLVLDIKLGSFLDVPLVHGMWGYPAIGSTSPLDNELELSVETTTQLLLEKLDGIAMDLFRRIYFALNWPKLVETPQDLENVLKKAYEFNNWKIPTDLKE
jgi:hypothetical protein